MRHEGLVAPVTVTGVTEPLVKGTTVTSLRVLAGLMTSFAAVMSAVVCRVTGGDDTGVLRAVEFGFGVAGDVDIGGLSALKVFGAAYRPDFLRCGGACCV
jgi:hypothetical protein